MCRKLKDDLQARELVRQWQRRGEEVVFTNGCFDLLHPGHVDFLRKARELGDRLVVGLNSDESVRKLKGDQRPVFDQDARSQMLSALIYIDAVIIFNEGTPEKLIKLILPDYLVKGGDYQTNNIVGAKTVLESGGKVCTIDLLDGYSTTQIITKIKGLK